MSRWLIGFCSLTMTVSYIVLLTQALLRRGRLDAGLLKAPFVMLLRQPRVFVRIEPMLHRQRLALASLNGGVGNREALIDWAAGSLGLSCAAFVSIGLLTWATGDVSLFAIGALAAVGISVARAKELRKQADRRRQQILLELPELLGKLLLLVNAGENVMRALARCTEKSNAGEHPLYVELRSAIEAMKRGESMAAALEEMGRRCAVPEAKLFATTILLNARRGGEMFVPALRELTRQMWDKRKALARTLGEQASSRLAFPLAAIFLLIMVLVGAPTILMM